MRKFLVFLLMVTLVPLAIGCRLFGGGDDDGPTEGTSVATNVRPLLKLPLANGLLATLKGENPFSISAFLKLNSASTKGILIDGIRWQELVREETDTAIFFSLPGNVTISGADLPDGRLEVRFTSPTKAFDSFLGTVQTAAATATNVDVGIEVLFSNAGIQSVQAATSTTGSFTKETFPTSLTPVTFSGSDPTTTALGILSLEYSPDGVANFLPLSRDPSRPTNIAKTDLLGMRFKVTFAENLKSTTGLTFTMTADNTKTTNSTTIDSLSGNATATAGQNEIVVTVTGSVPISATGFYKLVLTAFNGTNAADKGLVLPVTAYFVPGQTALSLTTPTLVNGVAIAGTVPVQDPNNPGKTTIRATFDGNITTAKGFVTLTRFPTAAREGTPELTAVFTATANQVAIAGAVMTVTFDQPLVAGKFYRVTYASGQILDANGNPVKVEAPIDFATQ